MRKSCNGVSLTSRGTEGRALSATQRGVAQCGIATGCNGGVQAPAVAPARARVVPAAQAASRFGQRFLTAPRADSNHEAVAAAPPARVRTLPVSQAAPRVSQRHAVASKVDINHEVVAFLRDCGLQMYAVHLLQHGFEEVDALYSLEEADMAKLGIPPYHTARLRKSLQERRRQREAAAKASGRGAVATFLEKHGLGQYTKLMLQSGFDEMETLLEVEDADLKDLGLPRGHALKLRRHLREHQASGQAAEEEKRPASVTQPAVVAPLMACSPGAGQAPPQAIPDLQETEATWGNRQRSWEKVQARGTVEVGLRVFQRFFELAPDAMNCFPVHVRQKYRGVNAVEGKDDSNFNSSLVLAKMVGRLVKSIGCTVAGFRDSAQLVPLFSELGARHFAYGGVREEFWPALGEALNLTLKEVLGDDFTPDVENAWSMVYGFMSQIMVQSMRDAKAAVALCEADKSSDVSRSTALSEGEVAVYQEQV